VLQLLVVVVVSVVDVLWVCCWSWRNVCIPFGAYFWADSIPLQTPNFPRFAKICMLAVKRVVCLAVHVECSFLNEQQQLLLLGYKHNFGWYVNAGLMISSVAAEMSAAQYHRSTSDSSKNLRFFLYRKIIRFFEKFHQKASSNNHQLSARSHVAICVLRVLWRKRFEIVSCWLLFCFFAPLGVSLLSQLVLSSVLLVVRNPRSTEGEDKWVFFFLFFSSRFCCKVRIPLWYGKQNPNEKTTPQIDARKHSKKLTNVLWPPNRHNVCFGQVANRRIYVLVAQN
jgi:hypothetical protein